MPTLWADAQLGLVWRSIRSSTGRTVVIRNQPLKLDAIESKRFQVEPVDFERMQGGRQFVTEEGSRCDLVIRNSVPGLLRLAPVASAYRDKLPRFRIDDQNLGQPFSRASVRRLVARDDHAALVNNDRASRAEASDAAPNHLLVLLGVNAEIRGILDEIIQRYDGDLAT